MPNLRLRVRTQCRPAEFSCAPEQRSLAVEVCSCASAFASVCANGCHQLQLSLALSFLGGCFAGSCELPLLWRAALRISKWSIFLRPGKDGAAGGKDGAAGTASSMAPKTRTFLELKTCLEKSYWHSRCCIAMWKLLRKH